MNDFRGWYDFLAPNPDAEYGTGPFGFFASNRPGTPSYGQNGSDPRFSIPEWLRSAAQGVVGLGESTQTGVLSGDALKLLTMGSMGTGALMAPRGALAAGAARTQKPSPGVFPQYAEVYPPVGPPVPTLDKKKTAKLGYDYFYPGKQLTPEAQEFKQARSGVVQDMRDNGYTPYFDPSKRYDVAPANYPPMVDTKQSQLMAQEKTREKYDTHAGTPEATARLDAAYQRGLQQKEGAGNWYMMGQVEDAFVKEYGPDEGRRLFKERFADAMAATTGGADPTSNLLMAHYGNYLKNKGAGVPAESHQYPFPIGGQYAAGNMSMFDKLIMRGEGLTDSNPKRYNFSNNFLGNRGGATIDEQMSRLIDPKMSLPATGSYGHYEQAVANRAQAAGVDPRYYQEVAWAGAKDAKDAAKGGYQAVPMIAHVNEAIERTSRLTGLSPDEVVRRGLVRSEIPLYSQAGGMPIPGFNVAPQQQQQPTPPGFRVAKDMVY